MAKNIRQLNGYSVQDPSIIANLEYNPMAGAQKVSEVGRRLIPFLQAAGTYTTNVSTVTTLPVLGVNLAIYNNSGSLASITLGKTSAVASLAPGVTDSSGDVGVPLTPNSWTYLACGMNQYVISSASTVLVFIIEDTSYIRQEVATYQGS
jgi:hypothetical protein